MFLGFTQKQNLSFNQTSHLGKYLRDLSIKKNISLFQHETFDREEISLVAKCFGHCILNDLQKDLSKSPFSLTIDNSTIAGKCVTALMVRYLKDYTDTGGFKRTAIMNRTIGIKYLKESGNAQIMLEIVKEKLLNFSDEIKANLIGYVHDHASTLSGSQEGLAGLLKDTLPNYFMDLKDPCHSLNLTLNQALLILPNQLVNFVDSINSHFSSTQRIAYLNTIQLDNGFKVLNPKRYADTRWLSLGQSLDRLIEIWDSLIVYMNSKPKYVGVQDKVYEDFIESLQNPIFRLYIKFFTKVINKMNHTNIIFQNQTLEIQDLKLEIHKFLKEFAKIFLDPKSVPKNIIELKEEQWEDLEAYTPKLLSPEDFITNIITDLDYQLIDLESLSTEEKKTFADTFQPFMTKMMSRLIYYLPFADDLINTLDFVTINMEFDELKKKILKFNKIMKIIPTSEINELTSEISQLSEENIILLKKEAKRVFFTSMGLNYTD